MSRLTLFAFVAGLASATGFAPLGWWPVTIAAFAVIIALVARARSLRESGWSGYAFGVGHFVVGLNWIAGAFRYQDAMPVWLGWVAVVALSLYIAVYPAIAALLAFRMRANWLAFALAFAAAWVATEWLRATLFTGFAWNALGVVLVPTPASGLARLVGTYGLSGVVVLVAAALASPARLGAFPVAAVIAGLTGWGILAATRPAADSATLLRVVQPNIGQADKYDPEHTRRALDRLSALTGPPIARQRLILWPEAALGNEYEIDRDRGLRSELGDLLGPGDVLLTGGDKLHYRTRRSGEWIEEIATGARNSIFAIATDGRVLGRYDKAHLVPYGEYLPMRPVLSAIGLSRLVPGDIDFWPGPGPATFDLPSFGRVGAQICYEIIFSGRVVDAAHRPRFVFNPSNDAWFGAWGPPQHLAQARLRAIEEGLPIVRSTPTGISAVIDAQGAVRAALPQGRAGFLQTRLPSPIAATPFARFGNALPLLFALALAVASVALPLRRR